ncbi:hypothetical protein GQ457_11G031210 [Hibiscus cannabinus]
MSSQKPQSGNIPSSFDENECGNFAFDELTMEKPKDDLHDEEESQAPKKKKKEKEIPDVATQGKSKRKSKWWAHYSDTEDFTVASCMKDLTLKQPDIIIDETISTLDDL